MFTTVSFPKKLPNFIQFPYLLIHRRIHLINNARSCLTFPVAHFANSVLQLFPVFSTAVSNFSNRFKNLYPPSYYFRARFHSLHCSFSKNKSSLWSQSLNHSLTNRTCVYRHSHHSKSSTSIASPQPVTIWSLASLTLLRQYHLRCLSLRYVTRDTGSH